MVLNKSILLCTRTRFVSNLVRFCVSRVHILLNAIVEGQGSCFSETAKGSENEIIKEEKAESD